MNARRIAAAGIGCWALIAGLASHGEEVTAFVPGKPWRVTFEVDRFEPWDDMTMGAVVGGHANGNVIMTVLVERVEQGTTPAAVREDFGKVYAGGPGVERLDYENLAVLVHHNAPGGKLAANGYLVKDDVAFDVHLSASDDAVTRDDLVKIIRSVKVEPSEEPEGEMELLAALRRLDPRAEGKKRLEVLAAFNQKYPRNPVVEILLAEEHFHSAPRTAEEHFRKALSKHRTQPIGDPRMLWTCLDGFGILLGMSGKMDESKGILDRGYELAEALENFDKKYLAASAYNLACWYAESGKAEESAQYLAEAVKVDAGKRNQARNDPSFAKVKAHPAFKDLL